MTTATAPLLSETGRSLLQDSLFAWLEPTSVPGPDTRPAPIPEPRPLLSKRPLPRR